MVKALAYAKDNQIARDAAAALVTIGAHAVQPLASDALARIADLRAADAIISALRDERAAPQLPPRRPRSLTAPPRVRRDAEDEL